MKHELCPFFFQVGHYQLGAHNITYLQQSNARLWHLVQVPYNIMDWGTNKRVTTLIWLWSWDVRATNDYEVKNSCIHFFWVWCDIISPPPKEGWCSKVQPLYLWFKEVNLSNKEVFFMGYEVLRSNPHVRLKCLAKEWSHNGFSNVHAHKEYVNARPN